MDARPAKQLIKELSGVLDAWGPIPGCPPGEYEAYAPAILGLLLRGEDERAVDRHLVGVLEKLGLGPEPAAAGARAICEWYASAVRSA